MSWVVVGKSVTTPCGKTVTMEYPVKEWVEVGDVLIVVLDVPAGEVLTENVFALSSDGAILWQIERTPGSSSNLQYCYVGITTHGSGAVTVASWTGMLVEVGVNNGKVIRIWFGK